MAEVFGRWGSWRHPEAGCGGGPGDATAALDELVGGRERPGGALEAASELLAGREGVGAPVFALCGHEETP